MSLLFADIYDGIRTIRITKGVCEKDILSYVQEKVGGCMNVGNVLKTIRTMKKLCEDGVLIKKGKRFMFAPKNNCEEEEEEEEEEDECADGEEDNDLDMEDDECDEEPEDGGDAGNCDEDDDDDDDDEYDDDDDDYDDEDEDEDDDDECDEKEAQAAQGDDIRKDKTSEMARGAIKSKESFIVNPNGGPNPNGSNNINNNNNGGSNVSGNNTSGNCMERKVHRTFDSETSRKSGSDRSVRKTSKDKPVVEDDTKDGTSRGSEAIAFCVRDFMDSQCRPQGSDRSSDHGKMEDMMEEQIDATKTFDFVKGITAKKRTIRGKRKRAARSNHRSRSPLKSAQTGVYRCQGQGKPDDAGFRAISSELFQEPADVDMEIDAERDNFDVAPRHRALPEVSPDVVIPDDPESFSEDWGKKIGETSASADVEEINEGLAKKSSDIVENSDCQMTQMTWFPLEEAEKEQEVLKRSRSFEDEEGTRGKMGSLCSVCEKKKKNS